MKTSIKIICAVAIVLIAAGIVSALPDTITCEFSNDFYLYVCSDNNVFSTLSSAEGYYASLVPAYVPTEPPITFEIVGGNTETFTP